MIITENKGNPCIMYDNFNKTSGEIDPNKIYKSVALTAVNITHEHIPDEMYIEEVSTMIPTVPLVPDYSERQVDAYIIQLNKDIKLLFIDRSTALLYFKILISDFSDTLNIKDKHPELFL